MKNKAPRKKPAVNRVYYIYVGILAVLFFTFHTIPFLKGVMYSFTDWRGYGEWNFVGLRNYIHMFSDVDTGNAYLFTFKFAVITTILVNVISLILACALNAKIKFKNTIKAFYFLPYMLGSLIVVFIFNYIFANLIPQLGKGLGIKVLSVNILGTNHAIWGIVAVSLWIGCAFNTLIYIAGLQSIDTDVYEAADLDGCNGIQRFFYITLPMIRPILAYTLITSIIGGLQMFDVPQILTNGQGNPDRTSMTLIMFLNSHLKSKNYGMAGSLSVYLFIVSGILCFFVYRMTNDNDPDGSKKAAKKRAKEERRRARS